MRKIASRTDAFHWLAVVRQAREGVEWAEEALRLENEARKAEGNLSVEQELQMIAEESELTNEVEKAKQRLRKQN